MSLLKEGFKRNLRIAGPAIALPMLALASAACVNSNADVVFPTCKEDPQTKSMEIIIYKGNEPISGLFGTTSATIGDLIFKAGNGDGEFDSYILPKGKLSTETSAIENGMSFKDSTTGRIFQITGDNNFLQMSSADVRLTIKSTCPESNKS